MKKNTFLVLLLVTISSLLSCKSSEIVFKEREDYIFSEKEWRDFFVSKDYMDEWIENISSSFRSDDPNCLKIDKNLDIASLYNNFEYSKEIAEMGHSEEEYIESLKGKTRLEDYLFPYEEGYFNYNYGLYKTFSLTIIKENNSFIPVMTERTHLRSEGDGLLGFIEYNGSFIYTTVARSSSDAFIYLITRSGSFKYDIYYASAQENEESKYNIGYYEFYFIPKNNSFPKSYIARMMEFKFIHYYDIERVKEVITASDF